MSNKTTDKTYISAAVHAVGNGKIIVYAQGPNLINLFGPPYSSPNILTIETLPDEEFTNKITRELGTAIWNHCLSAAGSDILEFAEFAHPEFPAYFRIFNCYKSTSFKIQSSSQSKFIKCGSLSGAWLLITPAGGKIFHYPTTLTSFHWIIPSGNCKITKNEDGSLTFTCLEGESSLAIIGNNSFADGLPIAEKISAENIRTAGTPSLRFLNQTRKYWEKFTENREILTENFTNLSTQEKEILDGVATLIKVQQSDDGGEMAGHYYPLAYVRDQYGVAKGMLALGMIDEAKKALEFRANKFVHFENLQNAESMGSHCARHIHENDDVEQTGYIILQARDYFNKTRDNYFIKKIFPMLDWCWNAQLKHLAGGSLPFNGDETYVAGGFFPRSGLLHGSADSTLVFIESGKWLANWATKNNLWNKDYTAAQNKIIEETKKSWRNLFFDKNKIYANAPEREKSISPPRFRHGVCENKCNWFGWTQRTKNGRYQCPLCFGKKILPAETPGKMEVNSVSLLPTFLESNILTDDELTEVVNHVLEQAKPNGHIPTIPGGSGCVGYDPGFLLYALRKINHPAAEKTKNRMIRMLDERGAWNEYYDENDKFKKANCRCRPWESAINAAAIIKK